MEDCNAAKNRGFASDDARPHFRAFRTFLLCILDYVYIRSLWIRNREAYLADIDLRPMSIGEVLDRTFSLYKKHFWLFAGITALPFLLLLILRIGLAAFQTANLAAFAGTAQSSHAAPVFNPSLIAGAVVGGLVFLVFTLLLTGAAQAATVFAVSDLYLGREATVREAYARAGRKAPRVVLILLLVGLSVIVGFMLLIVPGVILLCRTAVSVPAAMLEDSRAIRSIERSMELTKGFAMPIFLIFVLVWVMSYVAALVLQGPFVYLTAMAAKEHHTLSFGMLVLENLATFLSEVLVGPIGTIAFSLMYYNLRVRKEAFDVQHLMASMQAQPAVNVGPAI